MKHFLSKILSVPSCIVSVNIGWNSHSTKQKGETSKTGKEIHHPDLYTTLKPRQRKQKRFRVTSTEIPGLRDRAFRDVGKTRNSKKI